VGESGVETLNLHRFLIGLRRRHPWLHDARTRALYLGNTQYVYESRCGSDEDGNALIVALNLDAAPLPVPVAKLTGRPAEVVAGTAAPPPEVLSHVEVPAHGWLVLKPA
jgi:hypothetical protein